MAETRLDFGSWEQAIYRKFDGRRRKLLPVKTMGATPEDLRSRSTRRQRDPLTSIRPHVLRFWANETSLSALLLAMSQPARCAADGKGGREEICWQSKSVQ